MGKITLRGPVPPDHPMFSSGPEMFSPLESSQSTTTSASDMAGAIHAKSSSTTADPDYKGPNVTKEEELEDGAYRLAKFKAQAEYAKKHFKKD